MINISGQKIWSWIFQSYGGWIYDDSQNTDLPQATTNTVSGQRRYALPSTALSIQRVEVTDSGGNTRALTPLPLEKIQDVGVPDFMSENGTPQFYRVTNGAVELFPATSESVTDGMELYFERGCVEFASSATTAVPGFASPFHYLQAYGAIIEWLKAKQPDSDTLKQLQDDWAMGEEKVIAYYNKRWRDLQPQMGTSEFDWQ